MKKLIGFAMAAVLSLLVGCSKTERTEVDVKDDDKKPVETRTTEVKDTNVDVDVDSDTDFKSETKVDRDVDLNTSTELNVENKDSGFETKYQETETSTESRP
jgi:hypothetical protein